MKRRISYATKKVVSFTLVLAMLTSMTACGKKGNSNEKKPEKTTTVEAQKETEAKKETKFSVFAGIGSMSPDNSEKTLIKQMNETKGITIDWNCVSGDALNERKSLLFGTGVDMPDALMGAAISDYDLNTYGSQGLLIPLNDYINEETMPNLMKLVEKRPNLLATATMPDGNIYGLPSIAEMGFEYEDGNTYYIGSIPQFTAINKEWLNKLGLEMPKTIDDLHDVLVAFKENDVGWYINVHATTGMLSRACVRFHTVVFFARDLTTGEKLLELSYKGDYGAAVSNANEDLVLQPQQANCPNQKAIAQETNARKALRVFINGKDPGDYERWRGGTNRYLGMSFPKWSAGMTVDIRNPITGCSNKACSQASLTEQSAEQRSIIFHDLSFSYNSLLDKSDGVAGDGYFYTDPYGYVQDDDSLNTLRQYINPNFSAKLDGHYSTQDAWRGLYTKSNKQPLLELEDALGEMN